MAESPATINSSLCVLHSRRIFSALPWSLIHHVLLRLTLPGPVPGAGDAVVSQAGEVPALLELTSLWRGKVSK